MTWAKAGRFVGLLAVRLDCRLFDKYFMYMGKFWIQDLQHSTEFQQTPRALPKKIPLSQI